MNKGVVEKGHSCGDIAHSLSNFFRLNSLQHCSRYDSLQSHFAAYQLKREFVNVKKKEEKKVTLLTDGKICRLSKLILLLPKVANTGLGSCH